MKLAPRQFQTRILTWFDQHGRKHLPWQFNKTPYRVWISEMMLQQTQVKTVIPYFENFMIRFPDVFHLAAANEDQVLHAWSGLGYYSRARNLHRASKVIVEKYQGHFPTTPSELESLPGIGPSTAGAIVAIAFNERAAILDGNVKRVLARFEGIVSPINNKEILDQLWMLANEYTPLKRNADYTQAMMDMGATVCTRTKPQCIKCPLQKDCAAHEKGLTHLIPSKKTKPPLPVKTVTLVILKVQNKILLQKRLPSGIWGGLWSFPEIEGEVPVSTIQQFCKKKYQAHIKEYQALDPFRHTFSHYHLNIFPVVVEILRFPRKKMAEGRQIWYNPKEPTSIGLPKPIQIIMRRWA